MTAGHDSPGRPEAPSTAPTDAEPSSELDADQIGRAVGSALTRYGLAPMDTGGLLLALLLLVAFAPPLMFDNWTPRMAVLVAAAPAGLVLLVGWCRRRDRSALLLGAALAWTIVTALLSGSPRSALVGFVGRDLSALTVAGSAGCWAIGRSMRERGTTLLADVVMWAGALGAGVGVLQVVFDVTTGPLALLGARPIGFYGNPVYYGAISAAILMSATSSWTAERWRIVVVPLVVAGVATSLSGSRVALAAALVGVLALVAVRRSRAVIAPVVVAAGALLVGVGLDRWVGGGRNAADRLTEGTGGGRLQVWGYGFEAWLDRPIRGYGFGRFRPAVQERFSVEFVRDHAADDVTQAWFDAHNVVVGVLVAVGIVGLALFGAWVVSWGVRVRGPLAWALLPIALHWLLQPVSLFTLPLAMLLFGAAGVSATTGESIADRRVVPAVVAVGILIAVGLITADGLLRRAADDVDSDRAADVAAVFVGDSIVDDVVTQVHALDPGVADTQAAVLEWRGRVADDEPDRPYWWALLARSQIDAGRLADAERSIERALRLQPNHVRGWRAEGFLAFELGDEERLQTALDRLCELGQPECDVTAAELLESS